MSGWGSGYRYQDNRYGNSRGRGYNNQRDGGGRSYQSSSYQQNYQRSYYYHDDRSGGGRSNQGYSYRQNYERYNDRGGYQSYQARGRGRGYSDRYNDNYYRNNSYRYNDNYQRNNSYRGGHDDSYGGKSYDNKYQSNDRGYSSYSKPPQSSSPLTWGRQSNTNSQSTTIQDDLSSGERPNYLFTCYSHQRSGRNDLGGDVSFEEMRWWVMCAANQYKASKQQILQALKLAKVEKERNFEELKKQAHNPPSLGGPKITTRDTLAMLQQGLQDIPKNPFQPNQLQSPIVKEEKMEDVSIIPPPTQTNYTIQQPQSLLQQRQGNSTLNDLQMEDIQGQRQGQLSQGSIVNGKQGIIEGQQMVQQEKQNTLKLLAVWQQAKFEMGKIPEEPPPPEVCQ
eukprot:TRINITY_DN4050_c0_g1_i1.p1 TRINITY_DN4050_c0_g1~~TRINITY_DN4050_c0_g1_i1.p1  ORF type:complete len:394 (-),score=33.91 TRINITY_DN4050_c0_g1_i1:144-1325(-)